MTSACPSPAADELAGEVFASRYRVLKRIGAGGMGVVYRAWDHVAEGYVVVKSPHRVMLADELAVARFEREMESLTASVRSGDSIEAAQGLWIYRMLHSPHPLRETLTLIWHNRFATSATKVRSVALMQRQNELLRVL